MNSKSRKEGIILAMILGAVLAVTYPIASSTQGDALWLVLLELSIGPFFIIGTLGFYFFVKYHGDSFYNLLGILFNTLAGLSITMMITVQRGVFSVIPEYRTLENEASKEIMRRAFQIGNLTQLGMDFCFDVFVSLGAVFLGIAVLQQKKLFRHFGWIGILIGAGGLFINVIAYPETPDKNYLDPGPFFNIFYAALLINMIVVILKSRKNGMEWA
ncbi:MAG: hypothetical protein AAF391_07670 [Bacteroidota bacterium]